MGITNQKCMRKSSETDISVIQERELLKGHQ